MKRCADCRHAMLTTDEDGETSGECGLVMPFWVPLAISDYGRWVMPDDGAKCAAFSRSAPAIVSEAERRREALVELGQKLKG